MTTTSRTNDTCILHRTEIGTGTGTRNKGFLYYAMYCTHYTETGTWKGSVQCARAMSMTWTSTSATPWDNFVLNYGVPGLI